MNLKTTLSALAAGIFLTASANDAYFDSSAPVVYDPGKLLHDR